jgi:hypothetical protein
MSMSQGAALSKPPSPYAAGPNFPNESRNSMALLFLIAPFIYSLF